MAFRHKMTGLKNSLLSELIVIAERFNSVCKLIEKSPKLESADIIEKIGFYLAMGG